MKTFKLSKTYLLGLVFGLIGIFYAQDVMADYYYYRYYRPYRYRAVRKQPKPQYRYFFLGGGGDLTHIANNNHLATNVATGGGFDVFGGFRFNKFIGLQMGTLLSWHNKTERGTDYQNSTLLGITLDLKVILPISRVIEPYILIGGGFYEHFVRAERGSDNIAGGGGQAAVGLDINLGRWFTLGAKVGYRYIEFQPWENQNSELHVINVAVYGQFNFF